MRKKELLMLHKKFEGKVVHLYMIEYRILGFTGALSSLFIKAVRKIYKKLAAYITPITHNRQLQSKT